MAVSLPILPLQSQVRLRVLDMGGVLKSPTGGPDQRILRLGSRFAADITLPPMDPCAGDWVGARLQAQTTGDTLVLVVPQIGVGPTGVTGAGSANSSAITLSGGPPKAGQLFSFVAGGRNYLHVIASISGGAATVAPRLRAALSGAMDFVAPKLEGFADGSEAAWSVDLLKYFGQTFSLIENA